MTGYIVISIALGWGLGINMGKLLTRSEHPGLPLISVILFTAAIIFNILGA